MGIQGETDLDRPPQRKTPLRQPKDFHLRASEVSVREVMTTDDIDRAHMMLASAHQAHDEDMLCV